MQAQEIFDKLKENFVDSIIEIAGESPSDAYIVVNKDNIFNICQAMRDSEGFDFNYLTNLSGMDYKDKLGVIYHLYSLNHRHSIVVKAYLDRENPTIHSVESLWKTANWHEREAYDLFGIVFEGHPNLIRILCPYDWEGYPLRKDYVEPEYYHGIKVPY